MRQDWVAYTWSFPFSICGMNAYIYPLMFLLSVTCCMQQGIQLSFLLNTKFIAHFILLPEYNRFQIALIADSIVYMNHTFDPECTVNREHNLSSCWFDDYCCEGCTGVYFDADNQSSQDIIYFHARYSWYNVVCWKFCIAELSFQRTAFTDFFESSVGEQLP